MRHHLLPLFIAASIATPVPAVAFDTGATRENPLVCKRDRQTNLGSHMRATRTCMLRSAWRELEEHTQHELQQIMDGRAAGGGAEGSGVPGLNRPGPN